MEAMLARRTVILSDEINHSSIAELRHNLLQLQTYSNDSITLIIDSGGGCLEASLSLCDFMATVMTAPIRGVAMGRCGSAATFIMLHCDERVGTLYSRFLVHSGTRSKITVPINNTTDQHFKQLQRELNATEKMVLQLYIEKLTPKTWTKEISNDDRKKFVRDVTARGDQRFDEWLSVQEAIDIGLIESVVTGKLGIFPN
ncbi:MAG: ATP-dependent Clp protease proteolytic subunit [Patescibacteria group bacterium]